MVDWKFFFKDKLSIIIASLKNSDLKISDYYSLV